MSTFFYKKLKSDGYDGVKRWTKNVDIFEKKFLLIPIFTPQHWSLATINFDTKTISYYDSLYDSDFDNCLIALKNYMEKEGADKKKLHLTKIIGNWK